MSTHIELANAFKKRRLPDTLKGGFVVIYKDKAVSWMSTLHGAGQQAPGCFAIADNGEEWQATGGNDYDGANEWVKIK